MAVAPVLSNSGFHEIRNWVGLIVIVVAAIAGYVTMQNQLEEVRTTVTSFGNIDEKFAVINKDIASEKEKNAAAFITMQESFNKDLQRLDEKATINVEKHEERPHQAAVSRVEHNDLKNSVHGLQVRVNSLKTDLAIVKGRMTRERNPGSSY